MFKTMPSAEELRKHFNGKVIVASSAGANLLSKNYWSSKRAVPGRGRGVVDINCMVHFGQLNHEGRVRSPADWQNEEAEFQQCIGDGEQITHLPEGQFVVRRIN